MAEFSFHDFLEEEYHDVASEDILTVGSFPFWSIYGSETASLSFTEPDRANQVTFVSDLLHQRVEQSHMSDREEEFGSESVIESNLGVPGENRQMGSNLGLGLGFGNESGWDGNTDDDEDEDEDDCSCGGSVVNYNAANSLGIGDVLRIIEIKSDSDSEFEQRIDLHSEGEDYAVDNLDDEDISIPLCWDSLGLEDDILEQNNDFEWEELDDGVHERELLSILADDDPFEEEILSVVPISGSDEGRWEVLSDFDNMGRIRHELESNFVHFFGDHNNHTYNQEYELMFGQLGNGENPLLARPPASKLTVSTLPSVVITEENARNEIAMCAICKDQMEVNEEVKKLPCSHWYHGDCIIPWLGIRNTCPVCRHELPTDDPDYEQRRNRRAASQIIVTRIDSLDESGS